jgi:hypothetical protein
MVALLEAADTDQVIPGLARAAASARWPIHATISPTATSAPATARTGTRLADGGRPPRGSADRGLPGLVSSGHGMPGRGNRGWPG